MKSKSNQSAEQLAKSPNSQDVVDALHSVVCDVESFMNDWLGKIQGELAVTDTTAGNAALRRGFQGLQAEKLQWEAKHQCELEAIEKKANQLTEAWLKLESEQRQLLKLQDRQRAPRRQATPEAVQPIESSLSVNSAEPPSKPARRASNSIGSGQRSRSGPVRSLNDSVRQFQQLRREIEMTRAAT